MEHQGASSGQEIERRLLVPPGMASPPGHLQHRAPNLVGCRNHDDPRRGKNHLRADTIVRSTVAPAGEQLVGTAGDNGTYGVVAGRNSGQERRCGSEELLVLVVHGRIGLVPGAEQEELFGASELVVYGDLARRWHRGIP